MVVCNDTRVGGGRIKNLNLRHKSYKLSVTS